MPYRLPRAFGVEPLLDPALHQLTRPESLGGRELLEQGEAAGIDANGHAAFIGCAAGRVAATTSRWVGRATLAGNEIAGSLVAEAAA